MKVQGAFLRSRVARRIFALFVLSAALPMAVTSALSLFEVNHLLVRQSRAELSRLSANYGQAAYERLLILEDRLTQLALSRPSSDLGEVTLDTATRERASAVAIVSSVDATLPPALSHAHDSLSRLTIAQKAHLSAGKSLIISTTTTPPHTLLIRAVDAQRELPHWLVAEVNPAHLWGEKDTLPAMVDMCVLNEERVVIHCTDSRIASAVQNLDLQWVRTQTAEVTLRGVDDVHVAGYHDVFMNPQYLAKSWTVIAAKPQTHVLAPVAAFKRIYLPIIAVSVLLVGMLSISQIRRTLVPLERLIDATRSVTNRRFDTRIDVTRDDEFGQLARSFNDMTRQLGRQFNALTTLSEIDRAILSTSDVDQVLQMILSRLHEIVPADLISISVIDNDNAQTVRSYAWQRGSDTGISGIRTPFSPRARSLLTELGDAAWLDKAEAAIFLQPAAIVPFESHFVLPIKWKDQLSGVILLGYLRKPESTVEHEAHACEFRDRLAVALSSAAREEQLYFQARYDSLTTLPNRAYFKDQLSQDIIHAQRKETRLAVLFIDLDHFKKINDSSGHAAGDALLQEAAIRLRNSIRASDRAARLGGDEFTAILTDIDSAQSAGNIAAQIATAMSAPFNIDGIVNHLSASIGIAVFPNDGVTVDELIKNADTAMYRAKTGGRARHVFFEERMNIESAARTRLERELRHACDAKQFALHYQPQLDLRSGEICGAEALIRWHHPDRGMISPAQFIGLSEELRLIDTIGRQMIDLACAQYRTMTQRAVPFQRVSVNVSTQQLAKRDFVEYVASALEKAQMPPHALELEVTESVSMQPHAEPMLHELRNLGVRLALDDFGTGFSSLSYLKRLPVNLVKIDRSFIQDIVEDAESRAIVVAIIAMAHTLRKEVIAEGVETLAQQELLRDLGCDQIQGFYVAKPMPFDTFSEFMRQHERSSNLIAV